MEELKTKSQMIMRIAELSEQNTYLREETGKIKIKLEIAKSENELLKDANAHLKTELRQRYDEPNFESFRLMGKSIEEWKQINKENEELKSVNEQLKDTIKNKLSENLEIKDYKASIYRNTLEEIREKWNEFKKLSPLEISFNSKRVYELDKVINEVLK